MASEDTKRSTNDELVKILKGFDDAYFNGEALIDDRDYDALKNRLRIQDPSNPYLRDVGAPVRTGKEPLPVPMGSLDQLYDDNDLARWIRKYNLSNKEVTITEKLDGYSCLLVYENGRLTGAFSRGDGVEGASVLRHVRKMPSIPKNVSSRDIMYIRGEIILSEATFAAKYHGKFKNARNMASGCFNRTDTSAEILKDFEFFAHEWVNNNDLIKSDSIALLNRAGFKTPHIQVCRAKELSDAFLLQQIEDLKQRSPFLLDGVVVTINDLHSVENVSTSSSLNPEHSFKYKLTDDAASAQTEVVAVHWNASKNNLIKPRVEIKPVELDGVTITFATGHNAKFIRDNNVGPGSIVKVIRAGMVIPRIDKVLKGTIASFPTNLDWEWNDNNVEIVLKEKNSRDVVFKQVLDFFESLSVEQLKEASLQSLFDAFVTNEDYTDILGIMFDLTETEFQRVLGVNGKKIYASLHRRLENLTLPLLMGSLNYCGAGFGVRRAEQLLDQISWKDLVGASVADIVELHGFDEKTAQKICTGVPLLEKFMGRFDDYLKFKEDSKTAELSNLIVVMTGFRDDALKVKIESMGGKVGSSVSGKTTHLLVDGKSLERGSTKLDKARQLGVQTMTPEQFKDIFNL